MALSAQERRQWNELERQLTTENSLRGRSPEPSRPEVRTVRTVRTARTVLGSVIVLGALSLVILAVVVKILLIGVLGFVLMIVGGTRIRSDGLRSRFHAPIIRAPSENS
jgi:hypothetical protein